MSYTVVPTVATGDAWTASNHNLYIRDNFKASVPDVVTAKGDLAVGGGANVLTILGRGVDDTILFGDVAWRHPRELFQMCDAHTESFTAAGTGNIHIPTYFDVPEGAIWIYCSLEFRRAVSTAYFALSPSWDTAIDIMFLNPHGSSVPSQVHGIVPLDSTGGCYYTATDTADAANLRVHGYMS